MPNPFVGARSRLLGCWFLHNTQYTQHTTLRLFSPPSTYRMRCMHDMLWIKKRRIFHSLNEATTSICYQTHIGSEDGEHLLRIFHSLNESSTSSCYHLQAHTVHAARTICFGSRNTKCALAQRRITTDSTAQPGIATTAFQHSS